MIKAIPMQPEPSKELQAYMANFEHKHGRPMQPDEPLFNEDMWERLVERFREAGAPETFCYARLPHCQGEGRRFEAARRNFDQILSKQEGTCGSLRGLRWTSRLS